MNKKNIYKDKDKHYNLYICVPIVAKFGTERSSLVYHTQRCSKIHFL